MEQTITKMNEVDSQVYRVKDALIKASYVSNLGEEYFDRRDETDLTGSDLRQVVLGYAGAAVEHDVVHDYITEALKQMDELEQYVREIRGTLE